MLCRPAVAVIRPAAPSDAGPPSPQPAVGADVLVEPVVAVRRGDPLGLAPRQQRLDERVRVAMGLQPPGPRVGHLDADAPQQRPHLLGVAQVDGARPARGAAPRRRARPARATTSCGVRGRGPTMPAIRRSASARSTGRPSAASSAHSSSAVDSARAVGGGARAGRPAPPASVLLAAGDVERQLGPPGQARRRRRPRRPRPTPGAGARRRRPVLQLGGVGTGVEQVGLADRRGSCRRRARGRPPRPGPGRRATRRTAAGARRRRPSTWPP